MPEKKFLFGGEGERKYHYTQIGKTRQKLAPHCIIIMAAAKFLHARKKTLQKE